MAQLSGVFRLGRDAELRRTPSGETVTTLALAFNWGQRQEDGTRPAQWVEASLWGKRAESLAPYLLKGGQIYAVLSDPHIEQYEGRNGAGVKLSARVLDVELVGGKPQAVSDTGRQPQRQDRPTQPQQHTSKQAAPSSGFEDMDSDIPF